MNLLEINTILSKGESEAVEFKESFSDKVIETLGAFANTHGGTVLVGVRDNGHVLGVQIGAQTQEDIINQIRMRTEPHLQPSISKVEAKGKIILVVQVARSNHTLISVKGRFFERVGCCNQRMAHHEILQRISMISGASWDSQIETAASIEDLSMDKVDALFEGFARQGGVQYL